VIAPVFDGLTLEGSQNVTDDVVLANVRASIRRGHPQVWLQHVKPERVCIVGGGPSLDETFDELRDLVFSGAKLVTVNGAYQWCLDRNLRPSAQVMIDARPSNARFVDPMVPNCTYFLASQCAPEVWDAVEGRPRVAIWHDAHEGAVTDELDRYYCGHWQGIAGGTTAGLRAVGLMRTLGYLRFDLFGIDGCWLDGKHHAYQQPENDRDKRLTISVTPTGGQTGQSFEVAPWHVKQLEDLVLFMRTSGDKFVLNIHGRGLLAYALQSHADVTWALTSKE
jgi:hypothetical protein